MPGGTAVGRQVGSWLASKRRGGGNREGGLCPIFGRGSDARDGDIQGRWQRGSTPDGQRRICSPRWLVQDGLPRARPRSQASETAAGVIHRGFHSSALRPIRFHDVTVTARVARINPPRPSLPNLPSADLHKRVPRRFRPSFPFLSSPSPTQQHILHRHSSSPVLYIFAHSIFASVPVLTVGSRLVTHSWDDRSKMSEILKRAGNNALKANPDVFLYPSTSFSRTHLGPSSSRPWLKE